MNNFKEVYKKANDEIHGDINILKRPKKHSHIKPFVASAVAAAICITAVGILPGITGDVTPEQNADNTPATVSLLPAENEKARNTPVYFEDAHINVLKCVEISGESLKVEDSEENITTYKITPETVILNASLENTDISEISKGTLLTVETDEKGNAVKIILK